MNIVCNKCKNEFEPTQNMLIEQKIQGDLIEVYYICPKCHAKFHVCWHNAETKNLQKLIKRADNTGNTELIIKYKLKLKECLDNLNNCL